MMVVARESEVLPESLRGQQNLFRQIRQHAKANNDKGPDHLPAESLIAVLHAHSRLPWRKCFDSDPRSIARRILDSKRLADLLTRNPEMKDADPKGADPIAIPGKTPRPTSVLTREKGHEEIPKP